MKKILFLCLVCFLSLWGCSSSGINAEQIKVYEGFRESLMNNGGRISNDIPFTYNLLLEKKNDVYHYHVSIHHPEVYMGNIQLLVLNPDDLSSDYNASSKGIFDEQIINMIPNQEDKGKGVYNKIKLEGVSKKDTFDLYCMISYKDHNQKNEYRYYFTFNIVEGTDIKAGVNDEQ